MVTGIWQGSTLLARGRLAEKLGIFESCNETGVLRLYKTKPDKK
jgi:hypothetical protein